MLGGSLGNGRALGQKSLETCDVKLGMGSALAWAGHLDTLGVTLMCMLETQIFGLFKRAFQRENSGITH